MGHITYSGSRLPSNAGAILGRLLRRIEHGQAAPGFCTAAANQVRALATLGQVTTVEDRIAELKRAAGIGQSA